MLRIFFCRNIDKRIPKGPCCSHCIQSHSVTDQLIKAAEYAAAKDETYLRITKGLEEKHIILVKELIPVLAQSSWLSFVKKHFNDIEDLYNGIFVLGEFTDT
jgi:aspartokinase/homoserine dehydrogenase 1